MTWVPVPDEAVQAGAPASPFLMRALRDNDEAVANANLTIGKMLDPTIGHVHGVGTRTYTYNFVDRVLIKAGFNDCVPFRFVSPGFPEPGPPHYCATLTPGTWELDDLAVEIRDEMRVEVSPGSPATVPIDVVYDTIEGSPTRGLFVFKHTAATGVRILNLLFASGTNATECIGPSIGFAKLDRTGAFAYAGDSGFSDGYLQDSHTPHEGGLLGVDAWVPGAFTTVKMADNVIESRNIQNNAVSGSAGADKIRDGDVTGAKAGPPIEAPQVNIFAGNQHDFDITLPHSGTPMVVPYTSGGASSVDDIQFEIVSVTPLGGGDWRIRVQNAGPFDRFCKLAVY